MKAFKSINRTLPMLPDLIIEEIIAYAEWRDLLVWSQVSAFCFRIASRRIWSHLRLHDRALVGSKKCRTYGAEFMVNEEKLIKNIGLPLKGLADNGKQAFPLNIRAACVTQFTLSMGATVGGYRVDQMMRTLLPAIPYMSNLVLFDWDACRPPSRDVMLALVNNCNELTTFRCIPRRSEFSRDVQSVSGRYSNFDGLENLHDLKEISVRVRGATAAFRLCAAIKNSPALSRLSIVGPNEIDDLLSGLPDNKFPPLSSLSLDNIILSNGAEGQKKVLQALDPSTDTLRELTIEPCPGLTDPNFLRRAIFPNITSFKFKYQSNHYPTGREPDLLESIAQFVDLHGKLSKFKIERISNDKILPLPKSLLQALNKPERRLTALAVNAVDVNPDDLEELVKRHGPHLTNLAFFCSHVPLGKPTFSAIRSALLYLKGKKHVAETNLRESGVGVDPGVDRLVETLGTYATRLVSLQIHHSSRNLKPLGNDGPLLSLYRFKDIYQERSRERMRFIADRLPHLRFAGDWKVLAWYVQRDSTGHAVKLLDVDRVASCLEMGEMEESVLEKTFSWHGKFAGRRPWEGKLTTARLYR